MKTIQNLAKNALLVGASSLILVGCNGYKFSKNLSESYLNEACNEGVDIEMYNEKIKLMERFENVTSVVESNQLFSFPRRQIVLEFTDSKGMAHRYDKKYAIICKRATNQGIIN